jgi:hypothetical protein
MGAVSAKQFNRFHRFLLAPMLCCALILFEITAQVV